jgi:uncharacterized metal-binding protein YceD (DUF177 family)
MSETGPLSRPFSTDDLPQEGADATVSATAEERAALARDFGLVGIDRLEGRFHVARRGRGVTVTGKVEGEVTQTCVVTLEPFPAQVAEAVEVKFVDAPPADRSARAGEDRGEHQTTLDEPDPIVDGKVDLGALTAEFLALGLDPYPRKPGVAFEYAEKETLEGSPFAALKGLKDRG